jgi:hypothetical protein
MASNALLALAHGDDELGIGPRTAKKSICEEASLQTVVPERPRAAAVEEAGHAGDLPFELEVARWSARGRLHERDESR